MKKSIYSWALYDWANSAFATTVMAGFFPIFFAQYWSNPEDLSISTFYLGLGNSVASIIVVLLAPILGAIADRGTYKKRFLVFFAFLGILMTAGLALISQGMWQIALLTYVIATVGFSGANIFYDSLLPAVSNKDNVDYVSGLGYALGYIGGGILIVINFLMITYPSFFGFADSVEGIKWSFISVALWWAIFSIPILLFVKEPKYHKAETSLQTIKSGFKQLKNTFNEIRHLKVVFTFLIAYWLYIDGVDTTVRMAADFGITLGFDSTTIMGALVLVQFIAFFATLFYVKFADKIGIKNAIYFAIAAYMVIILSGYFVTEAWHFYVIAGMIGCFQGGIQTLSRSLYARIIPENKSAQFFGFFNMWGKFAAVIGPLLMGSVTLILSNIIDDQVLSARIGLQSIMILFILGALVLSKVNVSEGEKIAKEYL
ncbi:MAG: MFS transporter [Candidatus Neomarinimicrobiota bacterium]|nr:MFS transporter [Candidatus Neomarinimicrobiota bacterium]MEE3139451.1 MFS transporter [Candidatus Neomarinimicrobiota bacterium]